MTELLFVLKKPLSLKNSKRWSTFLTLFRSQPKFCWTEIPFFIFLFSFFFSLSFFSCFLAGGRQRRRHLVAVATTAMPSGSGLGSNGSRGGHGPGSSLTHTSSSPNPFIFQSPRLICLTYKT